MFTKLSFVIPVYNEERTLDTLLQKVLGTNLSIEIEIVAVNDCSKDRSSEILQKYPQVKLLTNEVNLGKTQSVKKGLLATTGDLVVIQDADLEYDPTDLVAFVEQFQTGKYDVIYGNRFGRNNKVIYWQNWLGNRFLSLVSSLFTGPKAGMWTHDMEVCYKMANGKVFREIAQTISAKSKFGLEPEITAKFSRYKQGGKHLRFYEIPVSYNPRSIAEGKHMSAFKDGLKAMIEIIKFNLV